MMFPEPESGRGGEMLVDLRNPRGLAFYSYDFDAAMLVKCVQSQRNPQSLQTLQMALQHKAYHSDSDIVTQVMTEICKWHPEALCSDLCIEYMLGLTYIAQLDAPGQEGHMQCLQFMPYSGACLHAACSEPSNAVRFCVTDRQAGCGRVDHPSKVALPSPASFLNTCMPLRVYGVSNKDIRSPAKVRQIPKDPRKPSMFFEEGETLVADQPRQWPLTYLSSKLSKMWQKLDLDAYSSQEEDADHSTGFRSSSSWTSLNFIRKRYVSGNHSETNHCRTYAEWQWRQFEEYLVEQILDLSRHSLTSRWIVKFAKMYGQSLEKQACNLLSLLTAACEHDDTSCFTVLGHLYQAFEELSIPAPDNFQHRFTMLGWKCLTRKMFLQFVQWGVFVPSDDALQVILSESAAQTTGANAKGLSSQEFKHHLITALPPNDWNSPGNAWTQHLGLLEEDQANAERLLQYHHSMLGGLTCRCTEEADEDVPQYTAVAPIQELFDSLHNLSQSDPHKAFLQKNLLADARARLAHIFPEHEYDHEVGSPKCSPCGILQQVPSNHSSDSYPFTARTDADTDDFSTAEQSSSLNGSSLATDLSIMAQSAP
jgi:hypothetical protein